MDTKSDIGSENGDSFDWGKKTQQSGLVQNVQVKPTGFDLDLKWNNAGEKSCLGMWGMGSKKTERRKHQHQKKLRAAAQGTHSIKSMFQRQLEHRIDLPTSEAEENTVKMQKSKMGTYYPIGHQENLRLSREKASIDLNTLLRLKTEQKKKYSDVFSSKPNLLRWHLFVQSFFNLQALKLRDPRKFTEKTRCNLATMVAHTYGSRGGTVRSIIKWETA